MQPYWHQVQGADLQQGDMLDGCLVPQIGPDFGTLDPEIPIDIQAGEMRLVIVTQSCDLQNNKAKLVALCPIHTLLEFEATNPNFSKKGQWELVRKGRIEGLHLLASPSQPDDNQTALVVDFGEVFSLPPSYLSARAQQMGPRWRLDSPFLEHFSQAFARYFMRVGLPSAIPPYK